MNRILVTIPLTQEQRERLQATDSTAKIEYIMQNKLQAQDVADRDIIIGNIPIPFIANANALKWLQLNMSGYEGYPQAMPQGVPVTNTRGAFGLAISEHMLGMLLMLKKKLHLYRDNHNAATWHDEGNVTAVEGSVVLVVGLGNIGSDFARKVKALGAYTIGIKRDLSKKPEYIDELYNLDRIDELIPRCDCIALSVPNDESTYKLMNRERINMMKQGAVLLNVGRGAAVDTDALAHAVSEGRIMAGVDVTDPEPLPSDHLLWKQENAIVTPHISGFFHLPETLDRIVDIACDNLQRFNNGEILNNIVG
ncbi:MAG: D-2-hydroxyacid dehydrogenase [Clostridia bacterium]|nr:D-2-hydroxyacid dehydrogenase [Clostridia bacterium]